MIRRVHNVRSRNGRRFGQIELGAAFTAGAHAARFIEHEKQRHMRHLEAGGWAHIHGKNSFERRAKIAARAVTLRSADDEQSTAEIAHIFFDGFHFGVGKLKRRDIIEHQEIVSGELG